MFTIGSWGFTKPELLAILCGLIVIGFFLGRVPQAEAGPGRTQSLGELAILAVRDQVIRPALGAKGDRYLPYLASMFFFILICNYMELIPFFQFPVDVANRLRIPARHHHVRACTGYQGFKTKGFFGYFRSWIPEAPWPILIILIPVEVLKYVIVQPATLAIRLFANMFAGHLLLTIFMLATW